MHKALFNQVILDSHVHYYDSWDISLDQLLSISYRNLISHIPPDQVATTLPAICLLDTAKSRFPINSQLSQLTQQQSGDWKIDTAEQESFSYWASQGERSLLIVSGVQLNTAEGLEVLLIGNTAGSQQGDSIHNIVNYQNSNTLTIAPWAVGKWLGKRKKIIENCIMNTKSKYFALGDNGGRPWIWKNIKSFLLAKEKGIPILHGSDPLPLKGQFTKSGSYGNILPINLQVSTPWNSITDALLQQNSFKFGQLSSLKEFIVNQITLRL